MLRSTRNGFCVYDSRGFEYDRAAEALEEVSGWVEDGVRHRQPCSGGRSELEGGFHFGGPPPTFARRRVNGVIAVANLAEIYRALKAGDVRPLETTRALFHSPSLRRCSEFIANYFALSSSSLVSSSTPSQLLQCLHVRPPFSRTARPSKPPMPCLSH